MSRLWPRSLAGQFGVLLVLAVMAAQVAAFLIFAAETSRVGRAAGRTQVVDRIATLVRVLDKLPAGSAADVLEAFSTRRHHFSTGPDSLVKANAMGPDEMRLSRRLARRLASSASDPRLMLVERDLDEAGEPPARLRRPEALQVSVRLSDGRWLNGEAPLRLPAAPWFKVGLYILAASILAILAVVAFVVGRIVRPLTALAAAAGSVGRGEAVEPIPAYGPQEVRTTIAAFNLMQQRLTRFVVDRTRMLAAISHDLRTPLSSLWLRAEMVEDADLRAAMVRTVSDMTRITEATLSFARDDAAFQDTRSVDLAALLEAAIEDHRAVGHDVTLVAPCALPIQCRPTALRRAVGNLIENAARYGERVRVTLTRTDDTVRIGVDDDGPGIAPDKMDEVFEPFVRIEASRNETTGGLGLGLAIARSAARAHGGDITLANRPEGGLHAEIVLPHVAAR